MEGFNEIYKKAEVLMNGALKKYADGKFEEGDKDRELSNKLFDKLKNIENNVQYRTDSIYGENRNFGIIYNIFENNTEQLFKSKNGRNAIREIVTLIRENKILRTEHTVYNLFKNIEESLNRQIGIEGYVKKLVETIKPVSKSAIIENNNKLISLFRKYKLNEEININDNLKHVYESIEFLLTHTPNLQNVKAYIKAENIIEENLKENIVSRKLNEDINIGQVLLDLTNKYKYSLNEDEQKVIDLLSENQDTEQIYNNYKVKVVENINNIIKSCDNSTIKANLNEVVNTINGMKFSKQTVVDDIIKLIKIEDKLND